jgi:hypothetical protein
VESVPAEVWENKSGHSKKRVLKERYVTPEHIASGCLYTSPHLIHAFVGYDHYLHSWHHKAVVVEFARR